MEFCESQTKINLARSFAGEAQAGLRYQIVAQMCLKQGYKILSDEIKALAKNEVQHAKVFFNFLTEKGGNQNNIDITAGYPFNGTTIEEGLKFALDAEEKEAHKIYPEFALIARQEGFEDVATKFELIAKVEEDHKNKFKYLYENFANGTLYKTSEPTMWQCSACGHIATENEAWDICPLCGASQGLVELKLP